MPHIFFERLEKRQTTQTLAPSIGANTFFGIYSVQVQDRIKWEDLPYDPNLLYPPNSNTFYDSSGYGYMLYGVRMPSYPYASDFPRLDYVLFGSSPWGSPFTQYNPWNSWRPNSVFSPILNFLGGLFGGSFPWSSWQYDYPTFPDFRSLYGVFPTPQSLNGVNISTTSPSNFVTYYGLSIPY